MKALLSSCRYEGVNGNWALGVLEQESVDFEILFCERFVPEMDGSLIKLILDYLITLALEYVGESQGDGQGKQKAEAPSSSLNSPLTNLKGLKSFSKRET